jgi:hypothetical protein
MHKVEEEGERERERERTIQGQVERRRRRKKRIQNIWKRIRNIENVKLLKE